MVGADKLITNIEKFLVSEVEQILHLCFSEERWYKKSKQESSMIMNEKVHDRPVHVFSPVVVVGERRLSRLTGPPTLDNVPELLNVKR